MNLEDYDQQEERSWNRLHEKRGKFHEVPAHHKAGPYLDAYLARVLIAADRKGPLFRPIGGKTGQPTIGGRPLYRRPHPDVNTASIIDEGRPFFSTPGLTRQPSPWQHTVDSAEDTFPEQCVGTLSNRERVFDALAQSGSRPN
jgi:hypothetical protein